MRNVSREVRKAPMTAIEGDFRIHQKEIELAQVQVEESAQRQVQSNRVRRSLSQTLTAAVALTKLISELAQSFGEGFEKVSDDLKRKP